MKKPIILFFALSILVNLFLSIPSFAIDKSPAHLRADELTYSPSHTIGHGKVVFEYEEIQITAHAFKLDNETHNILFEGNVKIYQNELYSQAASAKYIAEDGRVILEDGLTEFIGDFLKEPAYVRGKEIEIHQHQALITRGSITTCDLEKPHYSIKAESIAIYFGERIVLRNINYYEGSLRLFFFPFLVIPMGERAHFEFPQIGTSYHEGFFIKTRYNYYFSPESQGLIYLDYMEKKGLGFGVRHLYETSTGYGSIYLYQILSRNFTFDYNDFEMEIEHTYEIDDNTSISGGISKDHYISANFGADWDLPGSSWSGSVDYTHNPNLSYFDRLKGSLSINQRLWDIMEITSNTTLSSHLLNHRATARYTTDTIGWTLTNNLRAESKPHLDPAITSSYTYFSSNIYDGRLTISNNYRFNLLTQDDPLSTGYLSLSYPLASFAKFDFQANRYENYDRNRLTLSGRYNRIDWSINLEDTQSKSGQLFLDRYPEISITTPNLSFKSLEIPVTLHVKYGHLIEKPTMKESDRIDITADYRPSLMQLSENNSLRIDTYVRYSNYDNITERLATNFQGTLNTDLWEHISARNTYTNRQVFGKSPFESDRITHEHSILSNLDLSLDHFSFSINGKYDIPTETMGTITSTANYSFDRRNNISVTTNYKPSLNTFTRATASTRNEFGQYLTATNTIRYDLLKDTMEYLSTNINGQIGENWSGNYYHRLTTHGDRITTQRADLKTPILNVYGNITTNHTRDSITHLTMGGEINLSEGFHLSYEESLDTKKISIEADLFGGWSTEFDREIDQRGIIDSIVLIKDLHCRELRFYYDSNPQAFWLEYSINALDFSYFNL